LPPDNNDDSSNSSRNDNNNTCDDDNDDENNNTAITVLKDDNNNNKEEEENNDDDEEEEEEEDKEEEEDDDNNDEEEEDNNDDEEDVDNRMMKRRKNLVVWCCSTFYLSGQGGTLVQWHVGFWVIAFAGSKAMPSCCVPMLRHNQQSMRKNKINNQPSLSAQSHFWGKEPLQRGVVSQFLKLSQEHEQAGHRGIWHPFFLATFCCLAIWFHCFLPHCWFSQPLFCKGKTKKIINLCMDGYAAF